MTGPLTVSDVGRLASELGLELSPDEAAAYADAISGAGSVSAEFARAAAPRLAPERGEGSSPLAGENSINAWAWRCSIKDPAGNGPLAGLRIAVKDNICVAGLPMTAGFAGLEGYVAQVDAPVVTRMLQAGAEIVGKATCESLCFSSASHTAASGPVLNPYDHDRSTGGSSSGAAALVATGEADLAVGTDTAGSVRTPSAWCGVYGLKPTHGVVPTSGVIPIERSLDCVGPISRSVRELALLFDVLAADHPAGGIADCLDIDRLDGRRPVIGVLREGFGWPDSDPAVSATVHAALDRFRSQGCDVVPVSVPLHRTAVEIWSAIAMEGALDLLIRSNGGGTNSRDWTDPALVRALAEGLERHSSALSHSTKLMMLTGAIARRQNGVNYARARLAAESLKAAYDETLNRVDVLALPTNPMPPSVLVRPDDPISTSIARSTEPISNTCAFNVSGHPAITIPCGKLEGLPVGLMLAGRWYDERRLLGLAAAFEASLGRDDTPPETPHAHSREGNCEAISGAGAG